MSTLSIISTSSSLEEELLGPNVYRKRALSLDHPSRGSTRRRSLSNELGKLLDCDSLISNNGMFNLSDLFKNCMKHLYNKGFDANCIFLIQTYHYFGTSEEFYELLRQTFLGQTNSKKKELILNFMMEWLRRKKRDMESHLYVSIIEFITKHVKREDLKYFQSGNEACQIGHPFTIHELSSEKTLERALGFLYIQWKPQEIAEQLTLIHSYMFRQIRMSEFMDQAWQSQDKTKRAPFLSLICDYFNEVSRWVSTCVLTAAKMGKLQEIITQFIKIGNRLNRLHNFHMQQAIISGLTHPSVIRLEWNLAKEPQKHFLQLENFMSPIQNHRNYRSTLRTCKAPVLPCVNLILSDITFIVTGNTDLTPSKSINYEKFALLGRALETVWLYQEHADYILKPNSEILNFLRDVTGLSDDGLYELSFSIVPQGNGRKCSGSNVRVTRRRSFSLTENILKRKSLQIKSLSLNQHQTS